MPVVRELGQMLAQMQPELHRGRFVFTGSTEPLPSGIRPIMTFTEDEGTTCILEQRDADDAGLSYDVVLAWITLQVHSALDGVGLTAAVSGVLADAGISCNVVAATLHDHLFVPVGSADSAVELLQSLSRASSGPA